MDFDRDVTAALERMSIYMRERLRERLAQYVAGEGRERVTSEDLAAVRSGGAGMAGRGQPPERLPDRPWPALAGAYRLLDPDAAVAVCTLASEDLVDRLGEPDGVAIIGRAFTENLGAEKVAINVVANPAVRTLLLCGTESRHSVGQTLLALHERGLDGDGRVIGSEGPVPLVKNLPSEALAIFREKLTVVNLIDETDPATIGSAIDGAVAAAEGAWAQAWTSPAAQPGNVLSSESGATMMARPEDQAGFILVTAGPHGDRIIAEHYSRDAALLHIVAAPTAEALCRQLVQCGAVSELSHASYIGREALKAELALQNGLRYEQDRPLTLAAPPAS